MPLKDIVVHLDTGERDAARLELAIELSRRFNAHLTGLFVVDVPDTSFLYGAALPYATGGVDLVAQIRAEMVARGQTLGETFRATLAREGLNGEWRISEGRSGPMIALHARYADLTILGQPRDLHAPDTARGDDVLVTALLSSGRPVLAVPYVGTYPTAGERVLVAWNASREAARAVHDALPILQLAKKVTVLAINPHRGIGGHGDVPAADISLHLARHGVTAEAAHTMAGDITEAEALLSYAADIGADMIVAGGYGHSRVREMVFGGVTQTLLRSMTMPVLLSH